MSLEVWLAFVIAAAVVIGIPGPTNLLEGVDWRRRFNRAGGSMLIGAGVLTATLQRS